MALDKREFDNLLSGYASRVDKALWALLPESSVPYGTIFSAMRYSLLSGGKRLRPVLLLEFNRIFGGNEASAMPFACALEMIHTYSLIHDDLPCMDDDDLRRGRPTSHKVFGEAVAVLAGDGLLNRAFEIMSAPDAAHSIPDGHRLSALHEIAISAGPDGMIGGQIIDMESEGKNVDIERLFLLQRLKTGRLIRAACRAGCLLAGGTEEQLEAAAEFADALGLAFQIRDDMLDVMGNAALLGKPVGSDARDGKSTFPSHMGLDACARQVEQLTGRAVAALSGYPDTAFLEMLAISLMNREK